MRSPSWNHCRAPKVTVGCTAEGGTTLCDCCKDELFTAFGELPALYSACEVALGGSRTVQERVSGGAGRRDLPFNDNVAEVRSRVRSVLASWSALVVEERGVEAPERRVAPMARFCQQNVSWLAEHWAARDVLEELRALTRLARRATDSGRVRIVPLGACVHQGCSGKLKAVVKVPSTDAKPSEIRCSADVTHVWGPDEWAALRSDAHGRTAEQRAWYTVVDIKALWNLPNGSIYRLANQNEWRRRKVAGRVYYHAGDVTAALRG